MSQTLSISEQRTETPTPAAERQAILAAGGFGRAFSDHMLTIEWRPEQGWHNAMLRKREPISLDPAAAVLHYGQEIFEGMKAYRTGDGRITMFRPEQNARRMNASARRMAMPELPEQLFLDAVQALVRADRDWVPEGSGSLYLRPFMIACEPFLGVRPAHHFMFCIIASPAGDYFAAGDKPVKIWVSQEYSRAAPGGTGAAKCGGNYAAGLLAQEQASRNGCEQVIFLDSSQKRWLEELGGMNVFFVMNDNSIVTPELGTILPGITRASLIEIARAEGLTVHERQYAFEDLQRDAASGKVTEIFACGTAAVVAAIDEIRFEGGSFQVAAGQTGPKTAALRAQLIGIQRGTIPDTRGWVREIV